MTRYISWVLEVDIEFSSSSQLITLTSNHKSRIGIRRFKLLARPSRSSSTSTPTSLGHIVTLPSTPSQSSTPSPPSLSSLHVPLRRYNTQETLSPSGITPVLNRPTRQSLISSIHSKTPHSASVYQRNHQHHPAVQSRITIQHVRPLPIHASCMRSRRL